MTKEKVEASKHPKIVEADPQYAEGLLQQARELIDIARETAESFTRAWLAVNSATQAVEFALKALSIFAYGKYWAEHVMPYDFFAAGVGRAVDEMQLPLGIKEQVEIERLAMIGQMWGKFHPQTTYGVGEVEAKRIWRPFEAKMALKHAEEAYWAAYYVQQRREELNREATSSRQNTKDKG
jgi:HEPN domain-containing protein